MEVVLRQPLSTRVPLTIFGVLWCTGLATVGKDFLRLGLWPLGVVPLTASTLGALLFWRIVTASATTSRQGVRVRNILRRTVDVPWNEIDDIRIARQGGTWRRAIELVLRDGRTMALDVLSHRGAQPGLPAGRRLEAGLAQLRDRAAQER